MSVHLQTVRSWRENEIRPFAACNHSTDRLGFGCQQFTKARVAAIKWLKSLFPSEWRGVGEEWEGDPKTAWNSDYFSSVHFTQYHSLNLLYCLKNKRMGFDSGTDWICVCARACVCVLAQLCVCLCTSFYVCACIGWRSRGGNIFYKELSCQEAIVCAVRWQASNPGDGWRPADEKNK